jgi:hypothetical protein
MTQTTELELTELEKQMLKRGYASVRLVVLKIGRSHATVLRLLHQGELKGMLVGRSMNFIEIESVQKYMGPKATKLLGLTDGREFK